MNLFKKTVILLFCFSLISFTVNAAEYKIAVLAKDGPEKCLSMWKATADYLTSKVTGDTFTIVPLDFKEVNNAIQNEQINFFLVNSSMYITAKVKFNTVPVATMVNKRQDKSTNAFGGTIFAAADNASINTIADLKGKKFMAVEAASFGGWQMALYEMIKNGVSDKDLGELSFGGTHENVVLAVGNGTVDAGTVRTDTLERMAADGTIDINDYKILNKKDLPNFPFISSTDLYPEWPMARTKGTSQEIGDKVAAALKAMKPEDEAAKKSKVVGWSDPLDYTGVENLQKELKIEAYKPQ